MGWQLDKLPPHLRHQVQRQVLEGGRTPAQQQLAAEGIKTDQAVRRANKFGVSKVEERTSRDLVFDSKLEKNAYELLLQLVPRNCLHLQPRFELQEAFSLNGKKHRAIGYQADFLITWRALEDVTHALTDQDLVIDTKGMETPEFRLKLKLFEYRYQVTLHRVKTLSQLTELIETWKAKNHQRSGE